MKKIFLVPNPGKDKDLAVTGRAAEILLGCGAELYIFAEYGVSDTCAGFIYDSIPEDTDACH